MRTIRKYVYFISFQYSGFLSDGVGNRELRLNYLIDSIDDIRRIETSILPKIERHRKYNYLILSCSLLRIEEYYANEMPS